MTLLEINNTQFIADIAIILFILTIIAGYFINDYCYGRLLKKIYKKFQEKYIVNELKKSTSIDELKYSPDKLKKKNVYKSIERITKEVYIKKEIKVFNNCYECEIACRFLRNNRNIEAYLLMKKLFEEGYGYKYINI
ncbi:hypothetical protein PIROE2DRAFT_18236 [Piromyces sp. E2]|nr:hypothetical protein PIROE2DRAFT_18236 [Piromyces sp. E2]|eukprot:OUM56940.1 hypothetical protein PIROE2DRAFT_18236 [Piromyces sp. E2]